MSGSTSAVAAGEGFRTSFTAGQWHELEHQALIYKYLVAGLPVPPDLVIPIRMSIEALSARFFHPTLGYCSYYGKKFDPEPGRCRRTDGKKWRCSKDAYLDSKYCERHMHRGRNRSRKPVESQSTSSQSLSTAISHAATGSSGGGGGTYQQSSGGSGSFKNPPLDSMVSSDSLGFGRNISKLDMEPVSYGINNKEYRYIHGVTPDVDEQSFSSEASGIGRIDSATTHNTWRLMTPQVQSSSLLNPRLQGNSSQLNIPQSFEPTTIDSAIMSKQQQQRQQHCFFGNEIGSPPGNTVKQEPHLMRPFFDEWPNKARESWSDLDEGRSNNTTTTTTTTFSTTQLSISIPMQARTEFSGRTACSPDGADA